MVVRAEGPFDNDDAARFCADLQEMPHTDAAWAELDRAVAISSGDGYLGSPDVHTGVAASAVDDVRGALAPYAGALAS